MCHSYHPGYAWCRLINQGLSNGWESVPLEVRYHYMDTKRNPTEAWKKQAGEKARKIVDQYQPDVLVLADDDAQLYVGSAYVDTELPIVFCGVNDDPAKYGYPADNVTGFIERPPLIEALAFLRRFGLVNRLAFLSNDDNTSRGAMTYARNIYIGESIVEWRLVSTFDAWKKVVEEYNATMDAVLLYTYHTLTDEAGRHVTPEEVMRWTREHVKIPLLTFFEFGVPDGAPLGVVESGEEFGERSADYVLRILSGVSPADLPISRNTNFRYMVNTTALKRLNMACPPSVCSEAEQVREN
ncbi:MAG: ABC transporter substrate binding protein [Kiritimatiellae bacterium]|nr:ABC transporter substrate binding protein [Kiritimatiellia bacterium]MDD4734552.1 ABC transporter substrate binding protein [Kiritimatiellia bacterium]